MNSFDAIYFPSFEPPLSWLRKMLLLYDTIKTIVPHEARNDLSEDYRRLSDATNGALEPIAPDAADISMNAERVARLGRAFEMVRAELPGDYERCAEILIPRDGGIEIEGHVFMRHEKLSQEIESLLIQHGLLRHDLQSFADDAGAKGYAVVNSKASGLILSQIADAISRRHGWSVLTDDPVGLALNSINALSNARRENAAIKLASAIIRLEIPDEVAELPLDDHLDIRRSFDTIREPLHRMVFELTDFNGLSRIEDEVGLEDKVREIATKFDVEVKKIRSTRVSQLVRRWSPLFIGSVATVAGSLAAGPQVGAACALVSVGIQVLEEVTRFGAPPNEQERIERVVAGVQDKILKPSVIRRLL